ncbi:MAG: cation transporter [Anaerolineae bacterium]|nr:cation transporter [Anaerolineae bacterium]
MVTPNIPPSRSPKTTPSSPQVKRVLWKILGLNLLVAGAKIAVGAVTGSISMMADGFHSTLDGSSNVIGLVGLTIAERPPDETHPYGHQKFETFATLGIGLLLLFSSWNVIKSAFTRLVEGSSPQVTVVSFAVVFVTIGLNWWVSSYESRQGQRLKSSLLLADAAHTRSDIFVSVSVIAGLAAVKLGWAWVDAAVALFIVAAIGRIGWQIIQRATGVLADSAVVDPALVEKIALSVEGVESCHKIRSRGADQATYLDLHIQVDGRLSLTQAHYLGHQVQDRLQAELEIQDVVVHVEPAQFS